MGTFTEEITLDNVGDIINVRNGRISDANIRTVTLDALPDTGAWTPAINEEVRQKLGLAVVEMVESGIADGSTAEYGLTEPVEIRWKDRRISQEEVVVPNASEILMGALPPESMDLYVDPVNQRLIGVHRDQQIHRLK